MIKSRINKENCFYLLVLIHILMSGPIVSADLAFDNLIDQADNMTIYYPPPENVTVFASSTRQDFEDFKKAFALDNNPESNFPTYGFPIISLYKNNKIIAVIEYLPNIGIRCKELWETDMKLADISAVLKWFDSRKIPQARKLYEKSQIDEGMAQKFRDHWYQILPEKLKPFERHIKGNCEKNGYSDSDLQKFEAALYINPLFKVQQSSLLFQWYGEIGGDWTISAPYVRLPDLLLSENNAHELALFISTEIVIKGNRDDKLLEGIARYYSDWDRKTHKLRDTSELGRELKQILLDYIKKTNDPSKVARVKKALEN